MSQQTTIGAIQLQQVAMSRPDQLQRQPKSEKTEQIIFSTTKMSQPGGKNSASSSSGGNGIKNNQNHQSSNNGHAQKGNHPISTNQPAHNHHPFSQFKFLPCKKMTAQQIVDTCLAHNFSKVKYLAGSLRPDFSGGKQINDAESCAGDENQKNQNYNNYAEAASQIIDGTQKNVFQHCDEGDEDSEILNYDDKKINLVLDRIIDVTRDRVSPKDTLKLLELHAIEKLFTLNLISIEGVPSFYERPNFTKDNFIKSPAYLEWRKIVEKLNPSVPLSTIIEIQDKRHQQTQETDFKVPKQGSTSMMNAARTDITNDSKNRSSYNNIQGSTQNNQQSKVHQAYKATNDSNSSLTGQKRLYTQKTAQNQAQQILDPQNADGERYIIFVKKCIEGNQLQKRFKTGQTPSFNTNGQEGRRETMISNNFEQNEQNPQQIQKDEKISQRSQTNALQDVQQNNLTRSTIEKINYSQQSPAAKQQQQQLLQKQQTSQQQQNNNLYPHVLQHQAQQQQQHTAQYHSEQQQQVSHQQHQQHDNGEIFIVEHEPYFVEQVVNEEDVLYQNHHHHPYPIIYQQQQQVVTADHNPQQQHQIVYENDESEMMTHQQSLILHNSHHHQNHQHFHENHHNEQMPRQQVVYAKADSHHHQVANNNYYQRYQQQGVQPAQAQQHSNGAQVVYVTQQGTQHHPQLISGGAQTQHSYQQSVAPQTYQIIQQQQPQHQQNQQVYLQHQSHPQQVFIGPYGEYYTQQQPSAAYYGTASHLQQPQHQQIVYGYAQQPAQVISTTYSHPQAYQAYQGVNEVAIIPHSSAQSQIPQVYMTSSGTAQPNQMRVIQQKTPQEYYIQAAPNTQDQVMVQQQSSYNREQQLQESPQYQTILMFDPQTNTYMQVQQQQPQPSQPTQQKKQEAVIYYESEPQQQQHQQQQYVDQKQPQQSQHPHHHQLLENEDTHANFYAMQAASSQKQQQKCTHTHQHTNTFGITVCSSCNKPKESYKQHSQRTTQYAQNNQSKQHSQQQQHQANTSAAPPSSTVKHNNNNSHNNNAQIQAEVVYPSSSNGAYRGQEAYPEQSQQQQQLKRDLANVMPPPPSNGNNHQSQEKAQLMEQMRYPMDVLNKYGLSENNNHHLAGTETRNEGEEGDLDRHLAQLQTSFTTVLSGCVNSQQRQQAQHSSLVQHYLGEDQQEKQ